MQNVEVNKLNPARPMKNLLPAILLLISVAAGFLFYRSIKTRPVSPVVTVISQSALEAQYGLRVNLIAVTAAGGMVDVRLKIIDGAKAKLLLQDKKNFPALYIGNKNFTLNASEEAKAQEIKFEDDGNLFLIYPNTGNVVKPGTSVALLFGDTGLEPIIAK